MKILPTFKQLQYLVALADEGSFSRAAEACFVTQSTLSAGIAALETTLGQPVVDRSFKSAVLTPLGEEVISRARPMIESAAQMVESARHSGAPLSGPLRLGVIPTIAPYFLPEMMGLLQEAYPALDLRIHEGLTDELLKRLHDGKIDVALMAFPYKTPGLAQRMLFEEPFVLARPREGKKMSSSVTLNDLQGTRILLLEEGHCLTDHALSACRLSPPQDRSTFSATSLPTLIQMVVQGYGVTLLPAMAAKENMLPPGLAVQTFKTPAPARQIGLAWRPQHPRVADFALLADCMLQ